ncbi:hypothetical protein ACFY3U_27520 [Micromonospora sp. NPDC000089]|uniref:hypothetical protein n=1 Tax=unclassified Micromonospora TaxID=2617518 RepID=UPI0036A3D87C
MATAAPALAPLQAQAVLDNVTGAYYPVAPARLMDTRSGLGAPKKGKIGAGAKVDLQVTGRGGVPTTGVGAVVLNVTVTGPTADSFVTAYPAGETRPDASSVNFAKGWLGSNNVTVKLGAGGKVSVYNRNGSTDVVVDVVGWYAKDNSPTNRNGNLYEGYDPARYFDTREDAAGKALPGETIEYSIGFEDPVTHLPDDAYNSSVKGLFLNLTAVAPEASGFLTAWSGAGAKPTASTVNYLSGKNVPNLAFVQTTPCLDSDGWCRPGAPKFAIYSSQKSHIVVDLAGGVTDGSVSFGMRFAPTSPTRIVDSRINKGITGALGPNTARTVTVPSALLSNPDTLALAMNVTAVTPTVNTVVTVYPGGSPKPTTSSLNPYAKQVVSNGVLGVIAPSNTFNVHNLFGNTHLVADVTGTFYYDGATARSAKAGTARPEAAGTSHRR